jgi:hypothetical protein
MTALKRLLIVTAFLAGGPSLAMAQGLPTGGYPPVMGGAGGNPAVPGPAYFPEGRFVTSGTAYHQPIKHHRKIYMSAKSRH